MTVDLQHLPSTGLSATWSATASRVTTITSCATTSSPDPRSAPDPQPVGSHLSRNPPTFSNSSKMGWRTWDVQRDHVDLLVGVSRLLTRDGEAIFSCNPAHFLRPDTAELRGRAWC